MQMMLVVGSEAIRANLVVQKVRCVLEIWGAARGVGAFQVDGFGVRDLKGNCYQLWGVTSMEIMVRKAKILLKSTVVVRVQVRGDLLEWETAS